MLTQAPADPIAPRAKQLPEALAVDEFQHEELRAVCLFETLDLRDMRVVE